MPWKESSVMDERLRFIARLLEGKTMTDLCVEFRISRKTGYKIYDRYKQSGSEALTDRSKRPMINDNDIGWIAFIGWALTGAGCGLWAYGYVLTDNSLPFLNWPAFAPEWVSAYLPNWEAEFGFVLSTLGSVPLAYSQSTSLR
jgi:hypothetical protein